MYSLHHRELLGELSKTAYETVKELMTAAALEERGELFRHKVLGMPRGKGLLSEERIELLLSWGRRNHGWAFATKRLASGWSPMRATVC